MYKRVGDVLPEKVFGNREITRADYQRKLVEYAMDLSRDAESVRARLHEAVRSISAPPEPLLEGWPGLNPLLTLTLALRQRDWLPAIFFILDRAKCTKAALRLQQLLEENKESLLSEVERERLLSPDAEAYWMQRLERDQKNESWEVRMLTVALKLGIGAHHAGLPKKYRDVVEASALRVTRVNRTRVACVHQVMFRRGMLKVVFATGTLAMGINMPCRTAVFFGADAFRALACMAHGKCLEFWHDL